MRESEGNLWRRRDKERGGEQPNFRIFQILNFQL